MRIRMTMLCTALALLVVGDVDAQTRKARKVLSQLRTVDGAGSGLDADRLQGETPATIAAAGAVAGAALAGENIAQGLVSVLPQATYTKLETVFVAAGLCTCLDAPCDVASDLVLSCGASITPSNGGGIVTVVGIGQGGDCRACGCDVTGGITLSAQARCLALVR